MTKEFAERIPFNAVFTLRRGLNITRANYQEDGVPCLSYGDVHSRYLGFVDANINPLPKVSENYIQTSPQCLLNIGDCVFADTSEDYEGAGNCTCVLNDAQGLFAGYHTTVASPTTKDVCSRYYGYYFLSDDFRNQIRKKVTGIKVFSITNSILNATRILAPNLRTQENIANFLDKKLRVVDDLIDKKREVLNKLSEYRQSLITQAVTKGLDPNVEMKDSGIEWIGRIPKHWNIARVGVLYRLSNGLSKGGESFGHGLPFLTYGDAYKSTFTPKKLSGLVETTTSERVNYSVKRGDVFFTRTSETVEEIGLSSTCLMDIPDGTFAGFLIRARPQTTLITPEFAGFYFRSQCHRPFFIKEMNLVTRASLSQGLLSKLPVLIPPLEEQSQIYQYLVESCQNLDSISANLRKTLEELDEYRSSLISAAVTGKISCEEVDHES